MSIRGLMFGVLSVLGVSTVSPGGSSAQMPVSTGRLRLTFTERSPLSAVDLVLRRMDYSDESVVDKKSFEYDLAGLSFEVFVPRSYSPDVPHGLFVWMGVTDVPPAWVNVLARHKLILVVANTRRGRPALYGPPLDAVHNMKRLYNIDENRVYASGFSAGGQMATMMVRGFPEVFHGGLFLMGGHFYHSRKSENGQREPTVEGPPPAWRGPLDEIRQTTTLVMMKGGADTQWTATEGRSDYQALLLDGFIRVSYLEVPGLGHFPPNAGWFQNGVAALDQSEPRTPPVSSPTTDASPLPAQIAQAQRILATAQYYLELRVPQGSKEMQERCRKSYQEAARKYLERVLKEYPTTPAATRARELLHVDPDGSAVRESVTEASEARNDRQWRCPRGLLRAIPIEPRIAPGDLLGGFLELLLFRHVVDLVQQFPDREDRGAYAGPGATFVGLMPDNGSDCRAAEGRHVNLVVLQTLAAAGQKDAHRQKNGHDEHLVNALRHFCPPERIQCLLNHNGFRSPLLAGTCYHAGRAIQGSLQFSREPDCGTL